MALAPTHLHQVVEDSRVEGLGEGVPRVGGLLLVQRHADGLRLVSPLGLHLAAGQLVLQARRVDAQQVGGERQHWGAHSDLVDSVWTDNLSDASSTFQTSQDTNCCPETAANHRELQLMKTSGEQLERAFTSKC